MKTLYLESSAILAWLLGEPNATQVIDLINSSENVVSSFLSIIEVERALIRAEKQQLIKEGDRLRLKGLLAENAGGWYLLEINPAVRQRAAQAFPVEPVRSLDAIHLATILELLQIFPSLAVLAYDQRILDNLSPLGVPCAVDNLQT